MPRTIRHRYVLVALATALLVAGAAAWKFTPSLYRSPQFIEAELLEKTPIGDAEAPVVQVIKQQGRQAAVHRHMHIPAGSDYPPTKVAGEGFAVVLLGEYWAPFRTSVEAFYVFDSTNRLVGITVRKTIDAP